MPAGAREALERCLGMVDRREAEVRAWVHIDPEAAAAEANTVDQREGGTPLRGLVLGVKDIFDTADMPTGYGSGIFHGHRPSADAAAVSMLRAAGAVCLGKTVTAELAMYEPGPTRNPHRLDHTPGGSSSGSAAAVAAGMADIALGTQTAGSVIRPASYCGVWGMKPTFGVVPTAGVKPVAPSLDTVGWFAASAAVLDLVWVTLTGRPGGEGLGQPLRIALVRTEQWDDADADTQEAVEEAAERAAEGGAEVVDTELPAALLGLAGQVPVLQGFEACRSLHWERHHRRGELSDGINGVLDWGESIHSDDYDRVLVLVLEARRAVDEVFAGADVVLTPAVDGEAPAGLASTGSPRFARLWTALGWPTLSVPGLRGSSGLPVGVQLVARPGQEARLLACGEWLAGTFTGGK
ncbi:MAG: amidase [Acidimicrobiales bacterium]